MTRRVRVSWRLLLTGAGVVGLAAVGCSSPPSSQRSQAQASQVPAPEIQLKSMRIAVEGMSCSACVARIKTALSELEGVSKVDVDLGQRVAHVQFVVAKTSADVIVAKVNELGYRAGTAVEVH